MPTADLVVTTNKGVEFLRASKTGVATLRSVPVPGRIAAIYWRGRDLVVMQVATGSAPPDVGVITANGYAPLPSWPAATWKITLVDGREPEEPDWTVEVDDKGIWLGRCTEIALGSDLPCRAAMYARLAPDPVITREGGVPMPRMPGDSSRPEYLVYKAPTIPAPSTIQIALVVDPTDADGKREVMRCTQAERTVEFPPEAKRAQGFSGVSKPRWIALDPPMFQLDTLTPCLFGDCPITETFEGCMQSKEYGRALFVPGPHGFYVLAGEALSIRLEGKEVGKRERPELFGFVPDQK